MTGAAGAPPRQHRHLGTYGVCIVDNWILLVRKSRGPYTGMLDLPGGAIEFGESPEDALRREFIEETGLPVASATLVSAESNRVLYPATDGVGEDLHHVGLIYSVSLENTQDAIPAPKVEPDSQDSDGAAWFSIKALDLTALTPFARFAVMRTDANAALRHPSGEPGKATFGKCDPEAIYVDRRAAYAIILRGDTVATVRSPTGKYFLPGGGTLPGETTHQTALREIREELGCGARVKRWLGEALQYFYAATDDRYYRVDAAFVVAELIGEPNAVLGDEELHWLSFAEAQHEMFHEFHSWAIKIIRARSDAAAA